MMLAPTTHPSPPSQDRAALLIQKTFRGHRARKTYNALRSQSNHTKNFEKFVAAHETRLHALRADRERIAAGGLDAVQRHQDRERQVRAAHLIQRFWRRYVDRRYHAATSKSSSSTLRASAAAAASSAATSTKPDLLVRAFIERISAPPAPHDMSSPILKIGRDVTIRGRGLGMDDPVVLAAQVDRKTTERIEMGAVPLRDPSAVEALDDTLESKLKAYVTQREQDQASRARRTALRAELRTTLDQLDRAPQTLTDLPPNLRPFHVPVPPEGSRRMAHARYAHAMALAEAGSSGSVSRWWRHMGAANNVLDKGGAAAESEDAVLLTRAEEVASEWEELWAERRDLLLEQIRQDPFLAAVRGVGDVKSPPPPPTPQLSTTPLSGKRASRA